MQMIVYAKCTNMLSILVSHMYYTPNKFFSPEGATG